MLSQQLCPCAADLEHEELPSSRVERFVVLQTCHSGNMGCADMPGAAASGRQNFTQAPLSMVWLGVQTQTSAATPPTSSSCCAWCGAAASSRSTTSSGAAPWLAYLIPFSRLQCAELLQGHALL